MHDLTLRLLSASLLTGIAACGPLRLGGSSDEDALLYFNNDSSEQAAVYATSGAAQIRLGTVSALRTDTLRLPDSIVSQGHTTIFVRLFARNETPSAGNVSVWPGAHYDVRLASDGRTLNVYRAN